MKQLLDSAIEPERHTFFTHTHLRWGQVCAATQQCSPPLPSHSVELAGIWADAPAASSSSAAASQQVWGAIALAAARTEYWVGGRALSTLAGWESRETEEGKAAVFRAAVRAAVRAGIQTERARPCAAMRCAALRELQATLTLQQEGREWYSQVACVH